MSRFLLAGFVVSVPKKASARKPSAAKRKAEIAKLSRELEALMVESQLRQKVPKGMAQCPECGALIEPTANRRIRTHDNPVGGLHCEASKMLWAEFNREPPAKPKPKKAAPSVSARPQKRKTRPSRAH